jgi:hypothetical protein
MPIELQKRSAAEKAFERDKKIHKFKNDDQMFTFKLK